MHHTVPQSSSPALLKSHAVPRPRPAKAVVNSLEQAKHRAGDALSRAIHFAGLTGKEAAGLLDIDPAQLSRWVNGTEAISLARILNCQRLHGPFVIALAGEADGIVVDTVITVRRTA